MRSAGNWSCATTASNSTPAQTSLGYGLRRQVLAVAVVGEVGGQVSISSEVGVCTAVRLWGPAA